MENMYSFSWKRRFFSDTRNIYHGNKHIGFVKKSLFSRKATAEIDGEKYEFRDKFTMNLNVISETEIIDSNGNVIGKIKPAKDVEEAKATIEINNEISNWEVKSTWKNLWRVYNSTGLNILYKPSFFTGNGQIRTNRDDALKILSGLYALFTMFRIAMATLLLVYVPLSIFGFSILSAILGWIF